MTVAVIIPWRGGQPQREQHHLAVVNHMRALLPDAVHIDADSGHQPFSRAGSRNHGVRLAEQHGADVVVICDADTLVEAEPLNAAIEAARDGLLHLPFTRYRSLTALGLKRFRSGTPLTACEVDHDHEWATGGVLVMQPQAWWAAGGMDETFTGWGFEDTSFRIAADALLGPTVKHPGIIHHLWHPQDWQLGSEQYQRNSSHAQRYVDAEGKPDEVRRIGFPQEIA